MATDAEMAANPEIGDTITFLKTYNDVVKSKRWVIINRVNSRNGSVLIIGSSGTLFINNRTKPALIKSILLTEWRERVAAASWVLYRPAHDPMPETLWDSVLP